MGLEGHYEQGEAPQRGHSDRAGTPSVRRGRKLARVAEYARSAEEMGYDSLWVGDRLLTPVEPSDEHVGEPKPYPPKVTYSADPLALLTAAAAATSTIRLGSSTMTAPWHSPVVLARSLTTLDALSEGPPRRGVRDIVDA
ncbi:LLM class flavin-dependent oxidoreductase [Streptomyces sp. NPDC057137]|uniref:LLM class flavin-dependent oxidoreductase n=1 Tax=Streptomyces sp. NPDC057137 TaxID=3346030 RepID=UPI003634F689